MNNSPDPERDKLDRLLDETLKDIPEMQAPESLLGNVMARVAEEEENQQLSWFARLQWPVVAVSALFVFVVTYFTGDAIEYAKGLFSTEQFAGEIEAVNQSVSVAGTLLEAFTQVINLVPSAVLYSVAAAVLFFTISSFAGMGTVLFRISRPQTAISTH